MLKLHTYTHKSFIKTMTERIEFTLRETKMSIKQSICQSIYQSINQSVSQWIITTEITQNTTLGNMIRVKEHAINKIPIIMSVRKFKIMWSRAKTVTMISFYQRVSIASYASAGIARAEMSVRLSVRPSVCPSHSGIVSKRRKLAYDFFAIREPEHSSF